MKKLISVLSAAVLGLSAAPFTVCADSLPEEPPVPDIVDFSGTADVNGVLYTYLIISEPDKEIEIINASGVGKKLVIPSEIEGYTVIGIGSDAFFGCSETVSVDIPDTISYIGDHAFTGCLSLKDIRIPDSVTTLGEGCFMSCTSLQYVVLGDSVGIIPEKCFYSCTLLRSVLIPASTSEIGAQAFYGCAELSGIYIPSTVLAIGEDSIGKRYNLRSGVTENINGFEIKCEEGSAAGEYAELCGISCTFPGTVVGDANLDGKITAADASLVLMEYARLSSNELPSFCEPQKKLSDMNGDGLIDARDASVILKMYADLQKQ